MHSRFVFSLALACVCTGGIAVWARSADKPAAQPGIPQPQKINEVWLPPGEYSSIVIATSAVQRTWWVSIDVGTKSFPLTVGAQQTTVLTFDPPWKVQAEDDARITSKYVPFGDYSQFNPLADPGGRVQLFAWGMTTRGPVQFVVGLKPKP